MQSVVETVFDAAYLITVITLGILMIRRSGQSRQFRLPDFLFLPNAPDVPANADFVLFDLLFHAIPSLMNQFRFFFIILLDSHGSKGLVLVHFHFSMSESPV